MNKYIKSIPWAILLLFVSAPVFAQSSDPYERDIRIAEGILAELFDENDDEFGLRGVNIRRTTGEYIPGYGVHFRVGTSAHPETIRVILRGHAQIEQAEEPDSSEISETNKKFVEDRFLEYFKHYASHLQGLPESEIIRVTFGVNSPARFVFSVPNPRSQNGRHRNQSPPSLTAWASVSDIKAYNNGTLSEPEFENRIQIRNLSDQETERDQEVFSSILETSLSQSGDDQIRVRNNPGTDYLPGLGLHYRLSVSLRSQQPFGNIQLDHFEIDMDSLSIKISGLLDELDENIAPYAAKIDSMFNGNRRPMAAGRNTPMYRDSLRNSAWSFRQDADTESLSEEEVDKIVGNIHEALQQTVIDYGPTLRSLKDDEMLMITLNWSGRHNGLPQRSELRIKKSEILKGTRPEITIIERN